jgi:hypothetical protein
VDMSTAGIPSLRFSLLYFRACIRCLCHQSSHRDSD